VEGDVDPMRDMEIIQNELRLKDIEWVQKQLENLKKTGRSLGNSSLADKARKEEIVRASPCGLSARDDSRLSGYGRESAQVSERR
jgi:obg-like ATPase 1